MCILNEKNKTEAEKHKQFMILKKTLQLLALLCVLLVSNRAEAQQIPQYSHYLLNGTLVNPAYTGYREMWYAQAFYHNQWVRAHTPQYFSFSLDGKVVPSVNVGLVVAHERMGFMAISTFSGLYAYRIKTSDRSDLSFGISLGAVYYGADYNEMHPYEPYDPVLEDLLDRCVPNIDVGVYYGSDRFYAGLAARNITNGKALGGFTVSDYIIPLSTWNTVLTLGFSVPITENMEFRPSLMWQEDFKNPSHIDVTAAMLFSDRFLVGLSWRTDHHLWKDKVAANINALYSIAALAEVFITNQITLSYSFDLGLNQDSYHYFGGHEISIGYYFSRKLDSQFNRKYRYKKYQMNEFCHFCP